MNIFNWMDRHKRFLLFLIASFAISGIVVSFTIPVALFPHVNFPRIVVNLDAGDRPADRMVIEVTQPVEEAIRAVPGVRSVRSNTSRGSADISVNFDWGIDMISAMLQVESSINQVRSSLPSNTAFTVKRMDPNVFPVLAYSLTSDTLSLIQLRDIALYKLRPLLSTVRGVAKVGIQGGAKSEYQVMVNPGRLYSLGLTIKDVANALSASNVIQAVGRLEDQYKLYLGISDSRLNNKKNIEDTIIKSGKNGLVRLEDIAIIRKDARPQWIRVTADGHNAVIVQIFQQPGGSTVQISSDCKAKLKNFRKHLPKDLEIRSWYDQSELIIASISSVKDAVLIGLIFAIFILWIFLRNIKMTLIAAIMVPSVLAISIFFIKVFQMSFNIMTLGGLAASVGLIIDDIIVMEEHIVRCLAKGGSTKTMISRAVKEMTAPLAGSSMATIIVFVPLAFLTGVTGAFFKALSITMVTSLIVSFIVAWFGVPIMAGHLLNTAKNKLKKKKITAKPLPGFSHRISNSYTRFISFMLKFPVFIIPLIILLSGVGWFSYHRLGSGFMPKMDEGGFILDYRTPSGTSITETNKLLKKVEKILQNTPEVLTYSRRTGLALNGGITEANEGDFFIRLKGQPRKSIEQVMENVRIRITENVPGIEVEMAQLMEDLIGDLTAVPQPIEIKLFSDDETTLKKIASKVADAIRQIPGVVDVKDGIIFAGDAIVVHINRDKASLEGIDPEVATKTLTQYLQGVITTQIQKNSKMIGVRVWISKDYRSTIKDIESLQFRGANGHLFPLKRIATVVKITGQAQITRDNLKRMIAVTGRISGRDMGSVITDVKKLLNNPNLLPANTYYELGGMYRQQQIAFKGLILVFFAAVLLVFLVLLFLYEGFRLSLCVIINTLFSITAVLFGLWITDTELNISSLMGITMIVGIVTETAIFYLSEYKSLLNNHTSKQALILAGKNRSRPIAMTTVAAILALMPLAMGIGQGSAMLQPLALAIISGLSIQFPLVLFFLPVLVFTFAGKKTSPDRL